MDNTKRKRSPSAATDRTQELENASAEPQLPSHPDSGMESSNQRNAGSSKKPPGSNRGKFSSSRKRKSRHGRARNVRFFNNKENTDQRRAAAIDAAIREINMLQNAVTVSDSEEGDDTSDSGGSELEDMIDADFISALHNVDAKALGFIACAHETLKYLNECGGIPKDDPMMINLRNRLLEGLHNI